MKSENFVSICRHLKDNPDATQRELSAVTKLSLGLVNNILKECVVSGYLLQQKSYSRTFKLTPVGQKRLDEYKVKSAIILAAGVGSRFVPLTSSKPFGVSKVSGTKREPTPAARIIAFLTLYSSRRF